MNLKCLFTGHIISEFEIINEQLGVYQWKCSRCPKIVQRSDPNMTRVISMRRRDTMHNLAWTTLKSLYPETFSNSPGKTKHILSYHVDGSISFTVDLMPYQIERLRQILQEADTGYKTWKIQPLLRLVKD